MTSEELIAELVALDPSGKKTVMFRSNDVDIESVYVDDDDEDTIILEG